ncbi:MAG: hypothetical protein AB7U37_05550 [Synergistaceae bacterium]
MAHEYKLSNQYFTVYIENKGRRIVIELKSGVKASEHHTQLHRFVEKLHDSGVEHINADHISLPYLDDSISLWRGKRKLDCVYYKDGRIHECELKTPYEVGLTRTYEQLAEQLKHCENLILVTSRTAVENAKENLKLFKLEGIKIQTYD